MAGMTQKGCHPFAKNRMAAVVWWTFSDGNLHILTHLVQWFQHTGRHQSTTGLNMSLALNTARRTRCTPASQKLDTSVAHIVH